MAVLVMLWPTSRTKLLIYFNIARKITGKYLTAAAFFVTVTGCVMTVSAILKAVAGGLETMAGRLMMSCYGLPLISDRRQASELYRVVIALRKATVVTGSEQLGQ